VPATSATEVVVNTDPSATCGTDVMSPAAADISRRCSSVSSIAGWASGCASGAISLMAFCTAAALA
jgi:hypothetical protein